jgi:hypothetical protein
MTKSVLVRKAIEGVKNINEVWREVWFLKFSEESASAGDIFYPWMAFLTHTVIP